MDKIIEFLPTIITGLIVSLSVPFVRWVRNWWGRIRLRRIFGHDFRPDGTYHVVYIPIKIRDDFLKAASKADLEQLEYPYYRQPSQANPEGTRFYVNSAVATCELRSARYLATFFAKHAKMSITLSADIDIDKILDASWVSLGGQKGNIKSYQTQEDPENNLIKMHGVGKFVSAEAIRDSTCVIQEVETDKYDYGLILRIRPGNFPKRVHIACMGFREEGTSGATWFLCNKWKQLWSASITWDPRTWIKGSNFAAIIKVRKDSDESAVLLSKTHLVNSPKKVLVLCESLKCRSVNNKDGEEAIEEEANSPNGSSKDDAQPKNLRSASTSASSFTMATATKGNLKITKLDD